MTKRIVVAGCRDYNNYEEAKAFIDECLSEFKKEHSIEFVSGCCKGADELGERYAIENGYEVIKFPALWEKYGKAAGIKRNKEMAEACDMVICFWNGKSKGTASMIKLAEEEKKIIKIKHI